MQQKDNSKNITLHHAIIDSLSHDGRGVAHINNKITFIENALPGEEINFIYTKQYSKFNIGTAKEILKPSPERVSPCCEYYNVCGGCTLQHLKHQQQLTLKTKALQEQLKHISGLEIVNILPPIIGPTTGYRSKGRLAVKYVQKKEKVLVGFHEKNGFYVAEIAECPILHPSVGKKIHLLRQLISTLSVYQYIPQVEIACGNNITALVIRNLQKFSDADIKMINDFGIRHQYQIYAQSGGIDSIVPITSNQADATLCYQLPQQNINLMFAPIDFTQINYAINIQMVEHVLKLLAIEAGEKILDLFCGIGNFTLPMATKCMYAVGIEGNKSAIMRAKQNAEYNNIKNIEFYTADLTQTSANTAWDKQQYDKILLDPPRTGAQEICSQIKKFGAKKIVYVSCNPATFARDTKILNADGYELQNITLADMYPHTSHIEIISSFAKTNKYTPTLPSKSL